MRAPLIICLVLWISGGLANFLVQLSNNTSLMRFLRDHPRITQHVRQTFSFGNFTAFSGTFDTATIKELYNNLYVSNQLQRY
jgi:hypothetical protein